jgi:hypothetical protein
MTAGDHLGSPELSAAERGLDPFRARVCPLCSAQVVGAHACRTVGSEPWTRNQLTGMAGSICDGWRGRAGLRIHVIVTDTRTNQQGEASKRGPEVAQDGE